MRARSFGTAPAGELERAPAECLGRAASHEQDYKEGLTQNTADDPTVA